MAKVVQLRPTGALRTPVGHAIRTGETSYRQLENLHAEGRLPARGMIVDAPKARFQREFIRSLRGAERLARDPVHVNVDNSQFNKALSDWRKRMDSMTRMFETLSEQTRPSPPPLNQRQGSGLLNHRSSA